MVAGLLINGRHLTRDFSVGAPEDRQIFYLQLSPSKYSAVRNGIEGELDFQAAVEEFSDLLENLHHKVKASDMVVVGEGKVPLWVRFHARGLRPFSSEWPIVDKNLILHSVFLKRNEEETGVPSDAIVPASVEVPVIVGATFSGLFSLLSESMIKGGMIWLRVGLYEPFLAGPDVLEPVHSQIQLHGFAIQSQELAARVGEPTSFAHFLASKT